MGTVNSSPQTQQRAQRLAGQVGADHLDVRIDSVVEAMALLFATITGFTPHFRVCTADSAQAVLRLNTSTFAGLATWT